MAVPLAITFKGQAVGSVWSVVNGTGHNPRVKVSKVNNPIGLSSGFSVNIEAYYKKRHTELDSMTMRDFVKLKSLVNGA